MKMTLSTPNSDKQSVTGPLEKSSSPSSSPRSSPRPSPRPQTKRDHSYTDINHLSVSYKESSPVPLKLDTSPTFPDAIPTINRSSTSSNLELTSPPEYNRSESTGGSSTKDKKEGRTKKKTSWFNSLYPTYKSRSEDFKRIFKDVPDDERLVVDYSCALQKEILVHGRLYVSQNYLCFYANIFGWETNLTLKWKEVAAITKEKTALVIPNAVLICTRSDKYFFTSFVARDKTFLMLFRVWQNALLDQPMTAQEMWQWVHQCYGEELGLTSDDEDYHDYIALGIEEDKLSARLSVESFSEQECGSATDGGAMEHMIIEDKRDEDAVAPPPAPSRLVINSDEYAGNDVSDTTESDVERHKLKQNIAVNVTIAKETVDSQTHSSPTQSAAKSGECESVPICTSPHSGRIVMNEIFPIHIDLLFTYLFTNSKFFLDFHAARKTTDLEQTPWAHNPLDDTKTRVISLTMALNQSVGPKSAQVTETQVMLPCSKAGYLYSIDTDSVNAGIPYADSFTLGVHYCLQKVSETETSVAVFAQVKYKKSVWGLVKGMIEKSCYAGLDDFFGSLSKALRSETEEIGHPAVKRKSRRRRKGHSLQRAGVEEKVKLGATVHKRVSVGGIFSSDLATLIVFSVLILLVILNVMLYYKLWSLEEAPPYTLLDLHTLKDPPKSHDEWVKLLQKQETLHTIEIQKWQRVLKTAIKLLKQAEESLNELQRSIHPAYAEKFTTVLQNGQDKLKQAQNQEL